MRNFPWTVSVVDQSGPIQLIFYNSRETVISLMEFYNIDDAMQIILGFDKSRLTVNNPKTLQRLLEEGSEINYAFRKDGNVHRGQTFRNIIKSGEFGDVKTIARITGIDKQRVHEYMSRLKAEQRKEKADWRSDEDKK